MAGIAAGAVAASVTLRGQTIGTFTWSHNGEKLEVSCRGDVEFSDDDMDVRSLTPGGALRITERRRAGARSLELTADAAGNIKRRFAVGTSEKPFETEGRQWLSQILPHLIRHTGIGAAGRVARILRANGSAGVLAEISLIEGSWTKRLYFAELLKTPGLGASALQQALAQTAREVDSEPELAGRGSGQTRDRDHLRIALSRPLSLPLVVGFDKERLTPRGGPRQRAVVGAVRER
jgi:hypothetical protein